MDAIRGFSLETFVDVTTTNIGPGTEEVAECWLWSRTFRASTTDDNESFCAICNRYIGTTFTL